MRIHIYKLLLLIVALVMSNDVALAQYNWTKYLGNPVLASGPSGSWYRHLKGPSVLYNADSLRYEMWFTAAINWESFNNNIGFTKSYNGIDWDIPIHSSLAQSRKVGQLHSGISLCNKGKWNI